MHVVYITHHNGHQRRQSAPYTRNVLGGHDATIFTSELQETTGWSCDRCTANCLHPRDLCQRHWRWCHPRKLHTFWQWNGYRQCFTRVQLALVATTRACATRDCWVSFWMCSFVCWLVACWDVFRWMCTCTCIFMYVCVYVCMCVCVCIYICGWVYVCVCEQTNKQTILVITR